MSEKYVIAAIPVKTEFERNYVMGKLLDVAPNANLGLTAVGGNDKWDVITYGPNGHTDHNVDFIGIIGMFADIVGADLSEPRQ